MQASPLPAQNRSIYRHCMQQLILQALLPDHSRCRGFLISSDNTITGTISATHATDSVDHTMLRGLYQSRGEHEESDQQQLFLLEQQFRQLTHRSPDYYMILQYGHKGRVDALLFSDQACTQALELDMLEDGDLYPVPASS